MLCSEKRHISLTTYKVYKIYNISLSKSPTAKLLIEMEKIM